MPDLSLLKPISEALDISLNELLSGEKDINVQKANENISNITNYSNLVINRVLKNVYIILMFFVFVFDYIGSSCYFSRK